MSLNPLEQHDGVISQDQINTLNSLVQAGNFTQFYLELHSYGSTVAGLYIPGPTGLGIFGAYSHLVSTEGSEGDFFKDNQFFISTQIANGVMDLLQSSPASGGGFFLPSVHSILAKEIEVFTTIQELGSDAYAGHDLIAFFGVEGVPGTIPGGVGGSDFIDGIVASWQTLFSDGVFEYANETLNEDDAYDVGVFQFIDHPTLGTIPIGISLGYTASLLIKLGQEIDIRQDPDSWVNTTSMSQYVTMMNLQMEENKFGVLMNAIYGDAVVQFPDSSATFAADGTVTVVSTNAPSGTMATNLAAVGTQNECFPSGTLVALADGTYKPIETIVHSDVVLTHDTKGNPVSGVVDKLFTNTASEFIRLTFADGRDDLVATPGHRFLTETGDYIELGQMLRLGGGTVRVVDVDGSIVEAAGEVIAFSAETAEMFEQSGTKSIAFEGNTVLKQDVEDGWATYNFEVREHHNYVAGGVRVHNDSILSTLEAGDTLVALNDDLTNAAVLRDVDGDGTADFVTLDGFRDPDNGVFSTQIEKVRVKYWDAESGDLYTLLTDVLANSTDASTNVFDPGQGNTWNDGTWGDDIEEAFFDDVLGATGTGPTGTPTGTPPYDAVIAYVDGVPVTIPDVTGATDPITLLASLSGLIGIVDGLKPGTVSYAAGSGDVTTPAFEGVSGLAAMAFLLGIDLGFELIPAVTVDGPFGPIEVSPAVTLGSLLDGQVGNQSQFTVEFGAGIASEDVSQAQDGDNLVLTIDNGDGTTSTMTLEDVYADGAADEVAGLSFADGTTLTLDEVPETTFGDGIVTGTVRDDVIDATYVDEDGDVVTADADSIVAGLGDDVLAGGAGDDSLDGGDGTDRVLLDGAWDDFVFASDTTLTVTDTNTATGVDEGTDTLIDIEAIDFSDGTSADVTVGADSLTLTFLDAGGVRQAQTTFDTADTRVWDSYTQTFAEDGVTKTDQVNTYDDGRILDIDYDANGIRTQQTMTDVDNAYVWSEYTTTFAEDGVTRTDQVNTYDDGRSLDIDYDGDGVRTQQTMTDVDDVRVWSEYTTTFADDGVTRTDQVNTYDDGRSLDIDYDENGVRTQQTMTDLEDAYVWSEYTTTFADDGVTRTDQVNTYDDGRVLDIDYDENGVRTQQTMTDVDDARVWSEYTTTFAADGVTRTDQVNTYDDGRSLDIDYDANGVRTQQTMTDVEDAYVWSEYTTTFAADGVTRTDQVNTYDDGRSLDIDYDANGVRTQQTMTDVEGAYAWSSYTQTFDANGDLIDTTYNYDLG